MSMWLVTLEDTYGRWIESPVFGDTRKVAEREALRKWPTVEPGQVRAIYDCQHVDDLLSKEET